LLVGVPGRKLDIQTGSHSRKVRILGLFVEVPLHAEVGIARARRSWSLQRPDDGEVGRVHIQFQVVWKAVVELVVGGVLTEVRILLLLQSVKFIEKLEVPLSPLGDIGIIRVKGQLSDERIG
jgi:hypothetical protein